MSMVIITWNKHTFFVSRVLRTLMKWVAIISSETKEKSKFREEWIETIMESTARLVLSLKLFYHAHCFSYINYTSTVWSGANEIHLKKKMNSLYRRAGKITEFPKAWNSLQHHDSQLQICVQHLWNFVQHRLVLIPLLFCDCVVNKNA